MRRNLPARGSGRDLPDEQVPGAGRIVALLLLVVPFSQIPLDAYTPALPQMVEALQSGPAVIQNTVTVYMLGMSLALVPAGILADARGRRPVLLAGMALLVAMSFACAAAPNAPLMLVFRLAQGLGGAACMVISYAIAADVFRGARLTAVSGLLGAAWGLAPVIAPAIGGLLVEVMSWRMIFVLIGVLAALAMAAVAIALPETLAAGRRTPVSLAATGQIIAATLRHRAFLCFTLVFTVMASAQLVFGVVAPFLYQQALGFSPAAYGLAAFLLGGATLAGELGCTGLAERVPARRLAFGALAVYGAGTALLLAAGLLHGADVVSLSLGGALVLAACGVLCPMMYGMTLGLFTRNIGLIGGLTCAICYLGVSAAMATAAVLPDDTQTPVAGLYVVLGLAAGLLLHGGLPKTARPPGPDSGQREAGPPPLNNPIKIVP